ncbi:hypothetical protein TNCV_3580921 [Trichonephila clavipes]|nr:hypothetical protein TNCV_3580921 [Trichonephila clavipes]
MQFDTFLAVLQFNDGPRKNSFCVRTFTNSNGFFVMEEFPQVLNPPGGLLYPEKSFRKRLLLLLHLLQNCNRLHSFPPFNTFEVKRGQFYDSSASLSSENQEITGLQLAVKLPWAILYECCSSTWLFSRYVQSQ